MKIGETIRKFRKEKQLTQEEMANYLGVTAPAVNKWENGNSYPDISLLAPIARLLEISTDTLLSYEEELTQQEIKQMIYGIKEAMERDGYEKAFQFAESNIRKYPNCIQVAFLSAQLLDAYRYIYNISNGENYEKKIHQWYVRALESSDRDTIQAAAVSLFQFYLTKQDYEKAQEYLDQIPKRGMIHPKQMQANLYVHQGKIKEAYPLYEHILFTSGQELYGAINGLLGLAAREKDSIKINKLADKQKKIAEQLEMGKYMETSPELLEALYLQDKERIWKGLELLVHSIQGIHSFQNSELYSHMEFQDAGIKEVIVMLQKGLENDPEMELIKGDKRYRELLEELEKISEREANKLGAAIQV